jgi:Golgi phosphoprotein 3 (GPP34)
VVLPRTLHGRLYLIAYDRERRRLRGGGHLAQALRTAALAELHHDGHLVDENGKVHTAIARRPTDPILLTILEQIEASNPRSWSHWIDKEAGKTQRAIRDQLEAQGWLRIEPRKILGIIPADDIGLRNEHQVTKLMNEVTTGLRAAIGRQRVDPRTLTIGLVASVASMPTVLNRSDRWRHRKELTALSKKAGPPVQALRKVIQSHEAAAAVG